MDIGIFVISVIFGTCILLTLTIILGIGSQIYKGNIRLVKKRQGRYKPKTSN